MVSWLKILGTGHPPRAGSLVVVAIKLYFRLVEEYRVTDVMHGQPTEPQQRPSTRPSDLSRARDALRRATCSILVLILSLGASVQVKIHLHGDFHCYIVTVLLARLEFPVLNRLDGFLV